MEINQLTAELIRQIGYKPSKYQIGILEWVHNGKGNGACNAVAGAGKSSTLQMVAFALELIGFSPRDIRKSELFVVGNPDWLPTDDKEARGQGDEGSRGATSKQQAEAIASALGSQLEFSIPLELLEDEEVEDYSDWMPEPEPEDLDEPEYLNELIEAETYPEMERGDKEKLLPETTELFQRQTEVNVSSQVVIEKPVTQERTNAQKREQVRVMLLDQKWQGYSDRAIAKQCNVSAPFVGKMRAELERNGTVNISPTRVDSKGRLIDTANIGTKPLEPQTQDLTVGSPAKVIQAKLRIEGETKEDLDAIALLLQQNFEVVEQSRDYPNRDGTGYRRYLTVRVTSYQSISFP